MDDVNLSAVNLAAALDTVTEHWSPRVVGRVNDQYVKVAKLLGEFVWHDHADEDEMFLVVYGRLVIQIEDADDVILNPGEMFVVPKGVRHNPIAVEECGVVLVETKTTKHTGDVIAAGTIPIERQLGGS